jgi:hypothetical protein
VISMKNLKYIFAFALLCFGFSAIQLACASGNSNPSESNLNVRSISKSYEFPFVGWEVSAISSLMTNSILFQNDTGRQAEVANQIKDILSENEIHIFPPLNFRLEKPPYLLVISPRDKIYYMDRVLLRQDLNEVEMEDVESRIDKLGLSSLIVQLGGFAATYPPIIDLNSNLHYSISTIVEEWLHQYLVFKPLGFLYLQDSIGFRQDIKMIAANETLAGMVSDEITSQVIARYYKDIPKKTSLQGNLNFNFNKEMKETRKNVDDHLNRGNIEEAEKYMEARRLIFTSQGYKIRKLNQAYFAFHGIYGQSPSSVSPIHQLLIKARDSSQSLKDFLEKVSAISNYNDLLRLADEQ